MMRGKNTLLPTRPTAFLLSLMAKVLVTGAAGFIGSHTTDLLLTHGHLVCGVDNFRTGRISNLTGALTNPHFQFLELDFTEEPGLNRVLESFQPAAVIHLAALVSVPESISQPEENNRLNFLGTKSLARSAKSHGVSRMVFASSAAVYGDTAARPIPEDSDCRPSSPYGSAKLASELILLQEFADAGFLVRVQRYFNVFGPRQDPRSSYSGVISRFAAAYDAGQVPTIHGDGEQTRDFIAVADIARANLLAATALLQGKGVANICTGREVSLNQLHAVMGEIWGKALPPHHGPARAGDIRHSCGSPERARAELYFTARISLEDGLLALRRSY